MISTHHDPASAPSPGLLDQLRARDRAAFATLVDHYHPIMQRVARRFVATPAAADEVVQDTWLAVLERIDRFEERCSFKTWLFQILVNRARTTGAREARSLPVSALGERARPEHDPLQLDRPDDDTPQSLVMRSDAVAALARAIQRLPDRQRTRSCSATSCGSPPRRSARCSGSRAPTSGCCCTAPARACGRCWENIARADGTARSAPIHAAPRRSTPTTTSRAGRPVRAASGSTG
jgi:RNA polymerase sigma-70 factor, ECF subfamily